MSESLVSDIMLRLESSSNSSERVKVGSKIILMISHCSSVLEKLQLWAFRLATNDDERRARIGKAKPTYRSKEEVYLHHEDIKAELMNLNSNLPSTLLDYLAQKAMPTLNALYRQQLSAVFVTTPTAIEFSLEHKTAAKTLLRTKLLSSWERFLLCSAGTQHFDGVFCPFFGNDFEKFQKLINIVQIRFVKNLRRIYFRPSGANCLVTTCSIANFNACQRPLPV